MGHGGLTEESPHRTLNANHISYPTRQVGKKQHALESFGHGHPTRALTTSSPQLGSHARNLTPSIETSTGIPRRHAPYLFNSQPGIQPRCFHKLSGIPRRVFRRSFPGEFRVRADFTNYLTRSSAIEMHPFRTLLQDLDRWRISSRFPRKRRGWL